MNILKQSTAATIKFGPFIDDTDGKTAETSLTISQADIRLSKNGGDIAQTHNSAGATADELGYYDVPLDTTDTDTLGRLRVAVHKSGALPVWQDFLVVTANVYDTLCSTDNLDVNVTALADDVIKAASFDESTAFPLKSADTGSTQVARVGADSDTLETLSDEIAAVKAETAAILADTGTDGVVIASAQTVATVTNLTNLPAVTTDWLTAAGVKADAVTKLQTGLALEATLTAIKGAGWTDETLKLIKNYAVQASDYAEQVSADTAAIKAKTDNLPATPADEATLNAIKGSGWTNETLTKIVVDISNIAAGSGATAQEVWEYVARTLTDPDSYKADVSALATTTHLQEVEDKVDTVDTIADAIKAETDKHPTAAEIWANPTRTLTNATTGAVIPAAGETLEVTKDSTIVINLTGLGDISGLTDNTSGQEDKVWFTVKKVLDDADTSSVIQIHVLYPAGANPPDTLDYINGAAATATEGTFQFTDTTLGNATITIAAGAAAALPIYAVSPLDWDVKALDYSTGAVSVLATGKMYIYGTPTRSIT